MPSIGDIEKSQNIGKGGKSLPFIWYACEKCGRERWVHLINGEPDVKQRICRNCASSNHRFSDEIKTKLSKMRMGQNNSHWKGGEDDRTCVVCGAHFKAAKARVRMGRANCCSAFCHMRNLRKQGKFSHSPNKKEKQLIKLFTENNLPFKYTGEGDVWLGNRNPDFINTNGKKQVIELLGTYWHPLFDGANRTEHYKQYGYSCLPIWEDELVDSKKVLSKVKRFANCV
jgi:very-short-patch-repair endonuclease